MMNKETLSQTWRLAWPISLQSVLTSSLSMIDIAMISHLGDSAVGAVGLGNRFLFVVTVIVLGIAWTVGVLAAQFYGAGKPERIRSTILRACILANVALVLFTAWIFMSAESIIGWGTNSAEVIHLGAQYLWVVTPSLTCLAVVLILENAIRGLGEVRAPMVLSIFAISSNIALNYWLINGGLGVPALGVLGAAIATTIARVLHVFMLIAMLYLRNHPLRIHKHDWHGLLSIEAIKKFLALAVPMMISFGVWSSGTFVYQLIFGRMGTRELAVMSTVSPIEGVVLSLFFGLASACSITIGQHLGANRFDQAWRYAKSFAVFNPAAGFVVGLLILALRDVILQPFSDLPAETLEVTYQVYTVLCLALWLKIINMTLAMGILRAGGENKVCMHIDIVGMWLVSIPLTALAAFYFQWPLVWVVLVAFSEDICKGILFTHRVLKKYWLKNLSEQHDELENVPGSDQNRI